jgi:hypothetical protein
LLDAHLTLRVGLQSGLFSAVLTGFLAETLKSLQRDPTSQQVELLRQLVALQVNGTASVSEVITPPLPFHPSIRDIWINALWLVSLAITLVLAVMMLLLKQWTHRYIMTPFDSSLEMGHVYESRFENMLKWGVREIMEYSPFILHLSLFLFLIGLSIMMYPVRYSLFITLSVITGVALTAYIAVSCFPVFTSTCPYRTPLSTVVWHSSRFVKKVNDLPVIHSSRLNFLLEMGRSFHQSFLET